MTISGRSTRSTVVAAAAAVHVAANWVPKALNWQRLTWRQPIIEEADVQIGQGIHCHWLRHDSARPDPTVSVMAIRGTGDSPYGSHLLLPSTRLAVCVCCRHAWGHVTSHLSRQSSGYFEERGSRPIMRDRAASQVIVIDSLP